MILEFKFTRDYEAEDDDAKDMKQMAFVPQEKEQKGKLLMDPMVESSWKSKGFSVPIEETIALVGKSTSMPEVSSGGFAPQATEVGQMNLEAPPRYSGKRQLGFQVWVT